MCVCDSQCKRGREENGERERDDREQEQEEPGEKVDQIVKSGLL